MSFCVSPQPASLRTCSGSILPKNRMRTCRVFSRQTSLREQCVKPAHVRYDGTKFTMPIQETLAERRSRFTPHALRLTPLPFICTQALCAFVDFTFPGA